MTELSADLIARKEVVARWRSMVDQPCMYKLGEGGYIGDAPTPLRNGGCDCSGFAPSWGLKQSRITRNPFYIKINGGWIETTAMVADGKAATGLFTQIAESECLPGDLFAIPDGGGKQGHTGGISVVKGGKVLKVIDCSSSNPKGRAIQERDFERFRGRAGLVFLRAEKVVG